jgi:hypothetical protein
MDTLSPPVVLRKIWRNYVRDQHADPLKYFRPTCLADLLTILREAESGGYKVKAMGSGHSSSDIALTRDFMIGTHGLKKILGTDCLSLRKEVDASGLFFVEGGIRIRDVNATLDLEKKALINMGAYTGQTLAGVISTSTHGSGHTLFSFPNYVEAFILITENGEILQIERSGDKSISTGPANLGIPQTIRLVQDDGQFNAVAVSMGCMGIIYAVVLRVTEAYELKETRRFTYWSEMRKELRDGDVLRRNRHLEVLVSPYPFSKNDHKCLVTERNINPGERKSMIRRGHRKWFAQILTALFPGVIDIVILFIVNSFPRLIPMTVQLMLNTLTDRGYVDKSFKVLDLGKANNLAAYAMEIAFPQNRYLDAVEEILKIVNQSVRDGAQYLTGPFSLRFVKTDPLFLSMHYGETPENSFVCNIEFPTVNLTIGGMEILSRIEAAMYRFGARMHWGQVNHASSSGVTNIAKRFPKFEEWLQVYRFYCPKGRFQNDFTARCGIDV